MVQLAQTILAVPGRNPGEPSLFMTLSCAKLSTAMLSFSNNGHLPNYLGLCGVIMSSCRYNAQCAGMVPNISAVIEIVYDDYL